MMRRHLPTNHHESTNGGRPAHRSVDVREILKNSAAIPEPATSAPLDSDQNGARGRHIKPGSNGSATAHVGVAGNGNGHGNGNGNGHLGHVETVPLEGIGVAEAVPLYGTGRIRYGTREIQTGFGDLGRRGLGTVQRHLPGRLRTVSLRRLGLVVVLVMALVLGVAVAGASTLLKTLKGPASVVVTTAGPARINSQPGGVGSIAAAPQNIATVSLNVQGITAPIAVTAVDVLAGQQVAAGTPLLQLATQPFEQNEQYISNTLHEAESALSAAQTADAGGGAATTSGYLAVQIPTLAGQVAIDQQLLQIATGNSDSLTAPVAGYVNSVKVTPGQIVNPGDPLMQIVNPSQVIVSSGMQLSDMTSISPGDSATITPSQLAGVHLHGTVEAVSAVAADGGLEGTIVVTAANPGSHPVPIGTQAFINVSAPLHAAVSVPSIAILNVEVAPVVAVISHGDRIHFQPVVVGASDGTRTQILSGLKAGEQIGISNLQVLDNGDKVKPSQ
jgi:RND family efflux transporter MFP subunit